MPDEWVANNDERKNNEHCNKIKTWIHKELNVCQQIQLDYYTYKQFAFTLK